MPRSALIFRRMCKFIMIIATPPLLCRGQEIDKLKMLSAALNPGKHSDGALKSGLLLAMVPGSLAF